MALQSEVSPPMVGDPNKDTQIDGDTKSDEDSSQSTEEEVDLEEGEILDSAAEEEEEKDFTNISLKEALDKSCLQNIEELVNQAKNAKSVPSTEHPKPPTPRKMNKMAANYIDHDRHENTSDREDGWFPGSPKYKSKFDDKPMDYRQELEAYRGTPPSSPERKRSSDKSRKKRSSKKSKKTRKTIRRKDIKGMRVAKYKKESAKGRICRFYKEGKCAKGSDCLFSHSNPHSFKKRELCKFYLNGHCNKGKDCIYMHSEFPCKFYHTGSECYAKDDCRFSHTPLTDEMKRVLSDYLKMSHGDDLRLLRGDDRERDDHERERDREKDRERDRKRRKSRSPEPQAPPPKRTCLLGSPPRHIREAEETRRWQEEMKMLQQQNHPSFEIRLSPDHEGMSPPQFARPNFYQETLLNTPSPKKRQLNNEAPNAFHVNPSNDFHQESPSKVYVYDDDEFIEIEVPPVKLEQPEEFHWDNVHNLPRTQENLAKPFSENCEQELDFTNDVKFDETTQFSEMESSIDGPPNLSPDSASQATQADSEDTSTQDESKLSSEKLPENVPQEPPPPPMVIPKHLPRKQQELFMRVLQHQRKKISSPTINENAELLVPKEELCDEEETIKSEETKDSKWYSSDEDEDTDQPLTDVLKKIQQAPPPKPQVPELKAPVNLLDMFNKIQQKTIENQGFSAHQQQQGFWDKLFASVPTATPVPVATPNPVPLEPKRRTLLPNPVIPSLVKTEPIIPPEPALPKDPRLKNRDPRKLASAANTAIVIPKPSVVEKNNESDNSPVIQDLNPLSSKQAPLSINEEAKESIPYRLRGIIAKPPNYTPYLHASQSNPNLLKDPRLRKHLGTPQSSDIIIIGNGKDIDVVKAVAPPKEIPPMPELLLKYEPAATINIFESSSSAKLPPTEEPKPLRPASKTIIYDPRIKRRYSRSSSGADTPPHLTIVDTVSTTPPPDFKSAPVLENALVEPAVEKKWLPPVLEKSWSPPQLEKSWTATVKKEVETDSDSNHEIPPPLEVDEKSSSENKSPSPPPKEEFITVIKKEPPQDDSHPVVPTLIIKKVKPTVASHLPRAIADPRMARLHDPRRPRPVASDSSTKRVLERRKQPTEEASKTTGDVAAEETKPPEASESIAAEDPKIKVTKNEKSKTTKEDKPKSAKSIPKKRRLSDKSEEKKKTVHRNRKSSMDYASPLNSCDSTNVNKCLDYNSYNQRPKRTTNPKTENTPSLPELTDTNSIPEFLLSDSSSLECDNSIDVNLKDRFKTIDPTASPFC